MSKFDYYTEKSELIGSRKWVDFWILSGSSGDTSENLMHNISNIKIRENGKILNFISYFTEDLAKVKLVTPSMIGDSLLHKSFVNKNIRVKVFNSLLDVVFNKNIKEEQVCNEYNKIPIIDVDEDEIPF